ncbi:hypothetical protein NE237_008737 [Protea cynaroides]|uniref:Uncharacterized protein n=1 Tax=Protea cynaroides TaxID=273540 RepID=A0A9Q0KWG2_9MAGN|nr:hypothetical protein NE237_008737 [Protea cynaroides]
MFSHSSTKFTSSGSAQRSFDGANADSAVHGYDEPFIIEDEAPMDLVFDNSLALIDQVHHMSHVCNPMQHCALLPSRPYDQGLKGITPNTKLLHEARQVTLNGISSGTAATSVDNTPPAGTSSLSGERHAPTDLALPSRELLISHTAYGPCHSVKGANHNLGTVAFHRVDGDAAMDVSRTLARVDATLSQFSMDLGEGPSQMDGNMGFYVGLRSHVMDFPDWNQGVLHLWDIGMVDDLFSDNFGFVERGAKLIMMGTSWVLGHRRMQ